MSTEKSTSVSARFIEAVDWARDAFGLSQEKIAESLGVRGAAISQIRSGATAQPMNATVLGLKQFNINPAWVLTGVGKMLLDDVSPPREVRAMEGRYDPADERVLLLRMLELANQLHDGLRRQMDEKDAEIARLRVELEKIRKEVPKSQGPQEPPTTAR